MMSKIQNKNSVTGAIGVGLVGSMYGVGLGAALGAISGGLAAPAAAGAVLSYSSTVLSALGGAWTGAQVGGLLGLGAGFFISYFSSPRLVSEKNYKKGKYSIYEKLEIVGEVKSKEEQLQDSEANIIDMRDKHLTDYVEGGMIKTKDMYLDGKFSKIIFDHKKIHYKNRLNKELSNKLKRLKMGSSRDAYTPLKELYETTGEYFRNGDYSTFAARWKVDKEGVIERAKKVYEKLASFELRSKFYYPESMEKVKIGNSKFTLFNYKIGEETLPYIINDRTNKAYSMSKMSSKLMDKYGSKLPASVTKYAELMPNRFVPDALSRLNKMESGVTTSLYQGGGYKKDKEGYFYAYDIKTDSNVGYGITNVPKARISTHRDTLTEAGKDYSIENLYKGNGADVAKFEAKFKKITRKLVDEGKFNPTDLPGFKTESLPSWYMDEIDKEAMALGLKRVNPKSYGAKYYAPMKTTTAAEKRMVADVKKAIHKETRKKDFKDLNPELTASLDRWTATAYPDVRKAYRGNTNISGANEKVYKDMKKMFNEYEGNWTGEKLYRGYAIDDVKFKAKGLDKIKAGDKWDTTTPASWSESLDVAKSFTENYDPNKVVLVMEGGLKKDAYRISPYTSLKHEKEVLVKPGADLKVRRVQNIKGVKYITLYDPQYVKPVAQKTMESKIRAKSKMKDLGLGVYKDNSVYEEPVKKSKSRAQVEYEKIVKNKDNIKETGTIDYMNNDITYERYVSPNTGKTALRFKDQNGKALPMKATVSKLKRRVGLKADAEVTELTTRLRSKAKKAGTHKQLGADFSTENERLEGRGYFYSYDFGDKGTGIGVTNNPYHRFKEHRKNLSESGIKHQVQTLWEGKAIDVARFEKAIKNESRSKSLGVKGFNTETFLSDQLNREWLVNEAKKYNLKPVNPLRYGAKVHMGRYDINRKPTNIFTSSYNKGKYSSFDL